MLKKKGNITFLVMLMFMIGILGAAYAKAAEITIPAGYSLNINDGTLNMPEEGINNAGTLQVTTGAIKLDGNWTNTGTFIPGTGNVELIGTTGQTISGANTFYNLICTSAGNQLFFEAGKTQTVTSNWTVIGNAGSYLVLRSTVNGTQWYVDPAGTRNVSYVDVKDSVNSSIPPINPAVWTDQGNNVNWIVVNAPPLANAGQDQSAYVGNTVTLNGSGSSDTEGNPLSYNWSFSSKPDNSTAVLTNSTSADPIFTPDKPGTYIVSLTVNDGALNSLVADTVTITTINSAPIAKAGNNQSAYVNDTVTLDGSASSDVDGNTLTYSWTFTSRPEGSSATLANANLANPTFIIDKAGTYVVSLVVNDGTVDSTPATVSITTLNSAPVAKVGDDQTAHVGNTVTLNGDDSSDVDDDTLSYGWSFASIPDGSTATLTNETSVNPSFVVDKEGTYEVSLTVNDGKVNSAPDTVTITILNSAPVANAGADLSVYVGDEVTLNGGGSYDIDGDLITYRWTLESKPSRSSTVLNNTTSVNPTFTIDAGGTYVVSLIVNDGDVDSTVDRVIIGTRNLPPVANAGSDLSAYVGNTVTLDGSGSSDPDKDLITFSWAFTSKPTDSAATLSDPTSINPTFTIDKAGTYVTSLTVNDGSVNSPVDSVTISTINVAPVANANDDQSAYVGNTVTLDGSGSSDSDGNLITYLWAMVSKPTNSAATLNDVTAVKPTFTLDKAGTYVVSLMVNDGTVDSAVDTVTISTINVAPVANSGADQSAYVGNTVSLDGSGSTDPDGDLITYSWAFVSKPTNSTATLDDTTAVKPKFTVDAAGTYVVSLIVNDGLLSSNTDTVDISTINVAPVANAGVDQSVYVGESVALSGIGSYDSDKDLLTYSWAFTSKPANSSAALSDPTLVNPTFVVDKSGTYVVSLTVNDGTVNSEVSTVTISTLNSKPVAHAGTGQSVYVNDTVTLDGSGSTDVDGNLLTYHWAFSTLPAGSAATLSDASAVNPTYVVDKAGTYVVSLTVNDGKVNSEVVTVTISTLNSAPVAHAGAGQSGYVHNAITLDGSGSTDVDGDLLTYCWAFTTIPSGSAATLSDPTAVSPTFTIDKAGTYVISLVVNDGTVNSVADPVTINTLNSAPVADAGDDQSLHAGSLVTLDGSRSSDVDGNLLTYHWAFTSKPTDSIANLSNPMGVNPTFTVDKPGTYVVSLIVNDNTVDSVPDTVTIDTKNSAPVASAGTDQSIISIGSTVQLDGTQSYDLDGDPSTYQWSIISKPAGSNATLNNADIATPTFVADVHGDYVVQLMVKDPWVQGAPDTMFVGFENIKPVANAGSSQSAVVGNTVTLDGSASTDANGDLLTYRWALTTVPTGSTAYIANPNAPSTTFVPDKAGIYVVQLIVNDGYVNSDPAAIQIQAVVSPTAAITKVRSLQTVIMSLNPNVFKNANMQNTLINKLNAVIANIQAGNYADALGQLQNDILGKTDGCANGGSPDNNDWIKNCASQNLIYQQVLNAIAAVRVL